jgi:hypothetical protein
MVRTTDDEPTGAEVHEIERIHRSLTNVTPTAEGIERIEHVRQLGRDLATAVVLNCPPSRERSLALTHLEETVMWSTKSIVLES